MANINKNGFCKLGRQVIDIEIKAISELKERIDGKFAQACQILLECKGHVILMGMGKSGHIANKIAATFASTGTPAFFVHPGEASHGDLGMVTNDDVVIAISNSGNTEEILTILPIIKRLKIPLISLTGNCNSALAKQAVVNLDISVEKEACSLGLIPTSSTTTALVIGDALAITLLESRGFTENDFALSHPGGILGRRLLLYIDDLMQIGESIPKVQEDMVLSNALVEMTTKKLGMTTIVNKNGQLVGIFTDGDLRRAIEKKIDIHTTKISDLMTRNCKTVSLKTLAFDALKIMEKYNITSLVVKNEHCDMVGVVHMHSILKSGIM
ncbi:MAG: D-arabinose 5-phosphate isomerase [Coxiella sp. DG_40]|nr:MAG: D-arabinose 5-phosphate isomerase [Coxiella sp. DG_40]